MAKKRAIIYAVALMLLLSAVFIPVRIYTSFEIPEIVRTILTAFMGVYIAVNLVYLLVKNKRVKFDSQKLLEYMLKQKDKIRENYLLSKKKMLRRTFIFKSVFFLIFAILTLLFYSYMYLDKLALVIITALLLFALSVVFFNRDVIDPSDFASQQDYPLIYALASKTARLYGIENDIKIIFSDIPSVSIRLYKKMLVLYIGLPIMMFADKNEIEAIFVHEYSHFTNSDLHNSNKIEYINYFINASSNYEFTYTASRLFLSLFILPFIEHYIWFDAFYTLYAENKADEKVFREGYSKPFIDVLAKTQIFDLYYSEPGDKHPYESEEPEKNFFTKLYGDFYKELQIKKDFWAEIILKRIPSRIETHPLLSERMKSAGIESFNADFEKNYFREEFNKAVEVFDKENYEFLKASYTQLRQEYINCVNTAENYNKGVLTTEVKLYSAMRSFFYIKKYREALLIADRLLSLDPDNPHAKYFKGLILLSEYNEAGIQLIIEAIEGDIQYLEEGMEVMGNFMNKMGLSELREQMRKWQMEFLDKHAFAPDEQFIIGGKSVYNNSELSEEFRSGLLDEIKKYPLIKKVYLLNKMIDKNNYCYQIGLVLKGAKPLIMQKTLNPLVEYLDHRPEKYYLTVINFEIPYVKKVFKKKGMIIYNIKDKQK